jgi:folate-binding protein YgfZ
VGNDAVTAARIEAGYPIFGIDMDDDIIPLEAGVESRGVSFSKGCYVGQEVIIRVLHRGHGRVVRKLMGLRVEGEARPTRGARLRSGNRDIGFVTSAAPSPARLRAPRFPRSRYADRGRDRRGARAGDRQRASAVVRILISSSSAGGKPSVVSSSRAAHRISCPSNGRGNPINRHK